MKLHQLAPFVLVLLLAAACTTVEDPIIPLPFDTQVNFQRPNVGQKNVYDVYFQTCGSPEVSIPNQLTLAVTAVTDDLIEFTETDSLGNQVVMTADRVPGNLIISAEERALSQLLFFYGSDSLRLDAAPTAELTYRDCNFWDGDQIFTGDYVAAVDQFTFGGQTMTNLKTVSCVPIFLDLEGYLLYDENNLKGSIRTEGSWGGILHTVILLREE
ncbi:MAG: hypothetical protein ACJAZ9_002009 [Neolewinella sp.]|jgi:hypothetical protein